LEDLEEKEGARKGKEKDVTTNFFIAYSFSTSFSIFILTQSQKKGCHFIIGTVVDGGIVVNKYRVPFVVNVMSSCGHWLHYVHTNYLLFYKNI